MLKNRSVSLLLLILCAGIVLGVLLSNHFTLKTVEAQPNQKDGWEYCRVLKGGGGTDKSGKSTGTAYIEFLNSPSIKRETITVEAYSNGYAPEDALSQAFAKLGEGRWEMTQIESTDNSLYYYFKRVKQ
jgi:hypothetical protein